MGSEEEQQEEQDRNATTTYDLNVQNRKRKLEFLDQSRQCAGKPQFRVWLYEKMKDLIESIVSNSPDKAIIEELHKSAFKSDVGRRIFAYLLNQFISE